jgi:glycosyltransferase involved in cell wall biosynthesis
MSPLQLAYISFDIVPDRKGSATHIQAFAETLGNTLGTLQLVTVSPTEKTIPPQEIGNNIIQTQLPAVGEHLIQRVQYFRSMLGKWWQGKYFDIVQFRSIYEGFPIACHKDNLCRYLIFEVNGLPSIELKYRYPKVASDRELLYKLHRQEQICLEAADGIVTPSQVTKNYLQSRHIPPEKIRVIPNGVDLETFSYTSPPPATHTLRLLYFGTLAGWQGVKVAVDAIALAKAEIPVSLQIIGKYRSRQLRDLQKRIRKRKIQESVSILPSVSQSELVAWLHEVDATMVPLTACDRNITQGCCPLKILEAMAAGTPVIASNLAVVRELGSHEEEFLLVKPGSAKDIKEAMLRLYGETGLRERLASNARKRVEDTYTWQQAGEKLVEVYRQVLSV